MYTNFYQDQEMKYTEMAIVLEDFEVKTIGKFYIPILLPEVAGGSPNNSGGSVSPSNIVNPSGRAGIGGYTSSNYVELRVPGYIEDEVKVLKMFKGKLTYVIEKGEILLVTFVGGEANKPRIIGLPMTAL